MTEFTYEPIDYTKLNSAQEVFDAVRDHLLKHGLSVGENGDCMYRGPRNNAMCTVGCLLPNDIYTEDMERKDVHTLLNEHDLGRFKGFFVTHFDLLADLQEAHDNSVGNDLMTSLQNVALNHDELVWK